MYDIRDLKEKELPKYTGNITQFAGLKHYRMLGGMADGVEAVDVRTGSGFDFTVLPGRGMDIAWAHYKGMPVSYLSKTGVVGPQFYEAGGMGWLRNFFAGMLTTCGLSNVGGPCEEDDEVIGTVPYGLHGRITNTPAEQVCVKEGWEDGIYRMEVAGSCHQGCLHVENHTMRRRICTELGASAFSLRDEIRNNGTKQEPVMLMYHINVGYPILNKGSRLVISSKEVTPANEDSRRELDRYKTFDAPEAGYAERCYLHDMNTDGEGFVHVALVNDELGCGLALSYKKDALPYFNEWKMLSEGEYVVGLEPCNCPPVGRVKAREQGVLEMLDSCDTKETQLKISVLKSAEEIDAFETLVESL